MTTIDGLLVTARVIAWRKLLLTFLAGLVYGPVYAAGAAVRWCRSAGVFIGQAAKLGWSDGRHGPS